MSQPNEGHHQNFGGYHTHHLRAYSAEFHPQLLGNRRDAMTTGNFIAYYRVSTDRQGRSGLGLEAQQKAVMDSC